ncbi:MAG: DUF86 domain-containing protein [Candidatus Methanoplasma sp.]|jgi:uncharacterized protein with HEPN domain|nr:DUF86 domain-containing protein [Candidatus Methanoplasma sp.]
MISPYMVQTCGSDEEDFDDILLQYGCVFSLIQIGEYAKRLSSELKEKYPEVDRGSAAGMRDFDVHNYSDVDISLIRYTVLNKIPHLGEVCRSILNGTRCSEHFNPEFDIYVR